MNWLPESMRRIAAYSLVGVTNTVTDFSLFSLCVWGLQLNPLFANAIAFAVAVTQGFVLNTLWTFRDSQTRLGLRPYFFFVAINLGGLIVSSITIFLLSNWTGPFVAKLASVAFVLFWGYLMAKRFVFSQKPTNSNVASSAQTANLVSILNE